MKKLLSVLLFLLSCLGPMAAQGWERTFGGGAMDGISGMAITPDGGFILSGYYLSTRAYLIKADADGKQQWSRFYPSTLFGPVAEARAVVTTADSCYVVAGLRTLGSNREMLLFKANFRGDILWSKSFGVPVRQDEAFGLVQLGNGDLVIAGFQSDINGDEAPFVVRTDALGNQIWAKAYGPFAKSKRANTIAVAANGDLVMAGEYQLNAAALTKDVYTARLNPADGSLLWEKIYDLSSGRDDVAYGLVMASDGNLVVAGSTTSENGQTEGLIAKFSGTGLNDNPIWNEAIPKTNFRAVARAVDGGFFVSGSKELGSLEDLYVAKFSDGGGLIWETNIGKANNDQGKAVVATADGGVAAAGSTEQYLDPIGAPTFAYLVKADAVGRVFTSYLDCQVFRDFNQNCQQDTLEPNLPGWIVKVESPTFAYRYAITNSSEGKFMLPVDTGTYTLTLFSPNQYWQPCSPAFTAHVGAFYDTVQVDLPVRSIFDCPNNQVDVSTPVLRHCTENTYSVRYCNFGTAPSSGTYVDVEFDAALTVTGSSISGIQLPGTNTYRYQVGNLNYGDCGLFTIKALLDCNATVGQAHCVKAHIYPDSFCVKPANWDGSIIRALAVCDNDTAKLILKNVGFGELNTLVEYVIAEDIVMLTDPNNPPTITGLDPDEEVLVYKAPPSSEGKTLRVIAKQSTGYPGAEGYPTAAIEACVADNNPNFSTGFYTMFPEDDADDFLATDCQESTETDFTPENLKRGHPKGYGGPKYVEPQTDLDFLIQFRNSGPDTVQQVIIRDTLSAALDPATVRPGAASHAYDFDLYGNGIVQFTLPTANLLPDGSASEGFVRFRVSQRMGLPCNTEIRNRAAIYFDFNAPAITGETFHTVCERDSFLQVSKTQDIAWPGAEVVISPNPFGQSALFEVKGVQANTYWLELYDAQGRRISSSFHHYPTFRLFRDQMPAGLIYYRLAADGKPVATGKLIAGER